MIKAWHLSKDCIATPDNAFRFWLRREIEPPRGTIRRASGVLWIMLNPSTARGVGVNDPTQRRCVRFSELQGALDMGIVNLFARSTAKPKELFNCGFDYAVGEPDGREVIHLARELCAERNWMPICAWGQPSLPERERGLVYLRAHSVATSWNRHLGPPLKCLGLTNDNWPRHPLYLPNTSSVIPFDPTLMRN